MKGIAEVALSTRLLGKIHRLLELVHADVCGRNFSFVMVERICRKVFWYTT